MQITVLQCLTWANNGSNNDSGVLMSSELGKKLEQGALSIPQATSLDGCLHDPLPYFLVGDEIFP